MMRKTLYLGLIVLFISSTVMIVSAQVLPVPEFDTAYFKGNNGAYQIPYRLVNGTLTTSLLDLPAKELLFEINATSDGQLTVELPRTIIDSKSGLEDIPYFVSIYDIRSLGGPMRITPQELNYKDHRIVQVDFTRRTTEIAIAGTWFVENNSTNPSHWNPFGSLSPLQQYNKGITPKDIQCKQGFMLITKASNNLPACVKPSTVQMLVERGWAKEESYYIDPHMSPKVSLYDYFYDGIDKDNTTVSINNHAYYQTTLNYTVDNLRKGMSTQFHGVTFVFPEGILDTPGGSMIILDVKFSDGYEETYGKKIVNQDGSGSGSGIAIPSKFGPPATTSVTVLSTHVMPQAGLTIYHDKIKLLVSK